MEGTTTMEGAGAGGTTDEGGKLDSSAGGSGASSSSSTGGHGGTGASAGSGGGAGGCFNAADCPVPEPDCQLAICNAGICGHVDAPDGAAASAQVSGDCKKLVCISGVLVDINDDFDVNDDGKSCTSDSCFAGSPELTSTAPGFPCAEDGGTLCDGAGHCVQCLDDADCGDPFQQCLSSQCVPITCMDEEMNGDETDVDCGGPVCLGCAAGKSCGSLDSNCTTSAYCKDGVCAAKAIEGTPCVAAHECMSQFCVDGVCCAGPCTGICEACNVAMGVTGVCDKLPVGADPDSECPDDGVCNGAGACLNVDGSPCVMANECLSGSCADGVCCDAPCAGLCQACVFNKTGWPSGTCASVLPGLDPDGECPMGTLCGGGAVCALVNGPCSGPQQCVTDFCVDGVCCNLTCDGACQACSAAKKGYGDDGVCGHIAAALDPDDECPGMSSCNGVGLCK